MLFFPFVLAFYRLPFIGNISPIPSSVLFVWCVKSWSNSASGLSWAIPYLLYLKSGCHPARRTIHPGFYLAWCRQAEAKCRNPCLAITRVSVVSACSFASVGDSRVQKQEHWGGDGHLAPREGASSANTWAQPVGCSGSSSAVRPRCLTALWHDFLNTPCLLFLMHSEASPRVQLQGKDNAARCVWKWWCGAHTKWGFLLCPVLRMWYLFHLQSIFQPWTKSISWEHTPLPEQLMPGTSQEKLAEYDTPLLMEIKWCHISSALLAVLK